MAFAFEEDVWWQVLVCDGRAEMFDTAEDVISFLDELQAVGAPDAETMRDSWVAGESREDFGVANGLTVTVEKIFDEDED